MASDVRLRHRDVFHGHCVGRSRRSGAHPREERNLPEFAEMRASLFLNPIDRTTTSLVFLNLFLFFYQSVYGYCSKFSNSIKCSGQVIRNHVFLADSSDKYNCNGSGFYNILCCFLMNRNSLKIICFKRDGAGIGSSVTTS